MSELLDQGARTRVLREFARNLVVTAGAGTGKTSLLVGRLLAALLVQHQAPSRVIALTFTENATSEMRTRLVRLLRAVPRYLAGDDLAAIPVSDLAVLRELALPPAAATKAQELLAKADQLQISTFHGFCLRFLQRHARRLQLPARITLVDPDAARLTFEKEFVKWLAGRSRDALRPALAVATATTLRELAWQLGSVPSDTELVEARAEGLEDLAIELDDIRARFPKAVKLFREFVLEMAEACRALAAGKRPVIAKLARYLGEAPVPKPGLKSKEEPELIAFLHARVTEIARSLVPFVAGDAEAIRTAVDFVRPFVHEHRLRKWRAGTLAFDDLVLGVRAALMRDEELRERASQELAVLLVDEFQDTDPLQYEIVFLLCADPARTKGRVTAPMDVTLRPDVLCIVGDVKQSIYRFRRADVAAYAHTVTRLLAQGGESVALTANFRSRPPILALTNLVCAQSLRADPPWQHGYEPVQATRDDDPSARVELVRLRVAPDASAEERREAEGRLVVATIERLLREGRRPGDLAVLLRAATNATWLLRPLRESGVPYAFRGGRRFYDRHEVVLGTALLRAVACPHDVVAVLAVLRSAHSGATDLEIQEHARTEGAFDYLTVNPKGSIGETFAYLRALRAETACLPVDQALRRILLGPETIASEASGFEGAQSLANLERLCTRVVAEGPRDLVEAAAIVERRTEGGSEDEESPLFDEGQDVVRVMTVHASKGLEFPVVLVPDVGRDLDRGDRVQGGVRVERVTDRGGGHALAVRLDAVRNPHAWIAKEAGERHARAEQQRLFYVAATRAKEHLVLVAPATPRDKALWLVDLRAVLPDEDPAWEYRDPPTLEARAVPLPAAPERVHAALASWERRTARFRAAAAEPTVVQPSTPAAAGPGGAARAGLVLGRVVHEYLALVELARPDVDGELLRALLGREAALEGAGLAREATSLLERFHGSALRTRLVAAHAVDREHPLVQRRPDGTLVVGVLDALVVDPDGTHTVLDFKTERVGSEGPDAAARRHRAQLATYAQGVQTARGLAQPPRCVVHFLRDDVTVDLAIE